MSSFIKHIACPKCGSSDANALYADGGTFCWSCRTPKKGTISPYAITKNEKASLALPDDSSCEYPPHVLDWVFQYGLSIEELIIHDVVYSKYRDQLVFSWYDQSKDIPSLWQARNFSKEAKQKCFTQGTPNEVLPLYQHVVGNKWNSCFPAPCLVIVEDPISAIKVSRHCKAVLPILGSDLPPTKLKRIADVLGPFLGLGTDAVPPRVVVWLDGNMFHKAQKIAQRLEMLGVKATAVYTEDDPKACDDVTIVKMLANNL